MIESPQDWVDAIEDYDNIVHPILLSIINNEKLALTTIKLRAEAKEIKFPNPYVEVLLQLGSGNLWVIALGYYCDPWHGNKEPLLRMNTTSDVQLYYLPE